MNKIRYFLSIGMLLLFADAKTQTITTFAGGGTGGDGSQANMAMISLPPTCGIFDKRGNYYFLEPLAHKVRMVDTAGIIHTFAGNGTSGFSGDNGPAQTAQLFYPTSIAIDTLDNLYIADYKNYRIRKVNAVTNFITTIAGNGLANSTGDGGLATSASVIPIYGITVDEIGNIYLADSTSRIRKINTSGIIDSFAGTGIPGFTGDNGLALNAQIGINYGLCVDSLNNVYFSGVGRVRKINIATGIITTFVGNGNTVYNGENINALSASFDCWHITFDKLGNFYITDYGNNRIRKVEVNGLINTIAGNSTAGFSGDGGMATSAELDHPEGIAIDSCGNLYIADKNNYRIRKVEYPGCYLGVKNISKVAKFDIYPNPANVSVTIISRSKLKEVSIVNVLGRQVFSQSISTEQAVVDIEHLQTGIYFVVVTDLNGSKQVKKIIKE